MTPVAKPVRVTRESYVSVGLMVVIFGAAFAIHAKVSGIDTQLAGLTERARGQERGISEIKSRLDRLQAGQEEMRTGLVQLRAEVDSLKR